MRIRLEIKRHELPAVKVIFAIPDAPTSISKLVELVNDLVPLEAEDWGLEDYIVSVGDYECLHYVDAHAVLHDDDAVEIRALQSPDIRTRRVSSRYQVSSGGAHLIDGIAYGRSYVKRPGRPAVRIPPLKRPRLLYEEPEEEWSDDAPGMDIDTDSHTGQLRITSSFEDADGDESGENEDEGVGNDAENASAAPSTRTLRSKSRGSANTVRFEGIEEAVQDDDDESDEEDFVPDDSESSDEHFDDSDNSSQGSPTPQIGSDAAPQDPSQTTTKQGPTPKSAEGTKDATKPSSTGKSTFSQPVVDPPSSSNSSGSGSGNENGAEDSKTVSLAEPEQDAQEPKVSGPGAGSAATRARNQRRKNSKKREREVSQPSRVSSATVHEGGKDGSAALDSQDLLGSQRTHLRFSEEPVEALGLDKISPTSSQIHAILKANEGKTQSKMPNVLVSQTQRDNEEDPPEQISVRQPPNSSRNVSPQFGVTSTLVNTLQDTAKAKATEDSPRSASRRAKLDLASSRRLVFGSLGVRAPKNKAEESKLQAKLARTASSSSPKAGSKQNKDKAASASAQKPARIFTGDEWKEKIILSAEECYDEGVKLSTPPFPFVQRWDPQQQRGKKRKRAERGYYDGHFDNENGLPKDEGDAEYYDDADYDDIDVDYDEQDPDAGLEAYEEEPGDDLPPLPEDPTTLPELKQSACQPGQIIVFKQLEVSQATNWAPAMSAHKTALINAVHPTTGLMELTLASRDVPVQDPEYDEEGNRIYGKFEMPRGDDDDEEEEDPRRIEVQFNELVDPRILVDAPAQTPLVATTNGEADAGAASSPIEETNLIPDSLRLHEDDHAADADIEDELEEESPARPGPAHSQQHQQEEQSTTKSKADPEANTNAPNSRPQAQVSTTTTTSNEPSQALSVMSSAGAAATVANSGLDQAAQLPASLESSNSGEVVQSLKETPLMMEGTPVVEAKAG